MSNIDELIEQCKKMGMPQSTIHEGVKVILIPLPEQDGVKLDSLYVEKIDISNYKDFIIRLLDIENETRELMRQIHIALYGGK